MSELLEHVRRASEVMMRARQRYAHRMVKNGRMSEFDSVMVAIMASQRVLAANIVAAAASTSDDPRDILPADTAKNIGALLQSVSICSMSLGGEPIPQSVLNHAVIAALSTPQGSVN